VSYHEIGCGDVRLYIFDILGILLQCFHEYLYYLLKSAFLLFSYWCSCDFVAWFKSCL